jgi:cyclase
MKKVFIIAGSILAVLLLLAVLFISLGYHKFMSVEAVEYDPELEILIGGGGNSIILTSEDGATALVVDTKMGPAAKEMRKKVMAKKEIIVVNTHVHRDHVGGNALYAGATIIAGAYSKEQWASLAGKNRYPDSTVNVGEEKVLRVGSETVHIRNTGQAHTWNDAVVYLEKRKLLVTGDIVFLGRHPVLFAQGGSNVASWINVLDSLYNRYEIKTLVPGHGAVSDKSALLNMREYFAAIRDAIDDPQRLSSLREKYKEYSSVPGMSGFGKTVEFIRNEKRRKYFYVLTIFPQAVLLLDRSPISISGKFKVYSNCGQGERAFIWPLWLKNIADRRKASSRSSSLTLRA